MFVAAHAWPVVGQDPGGEKAFVLPYQTHRLSQALGILLPTAGHVPPPRRQFHCRGYGYRGGGAAAAML